MLQMRGEPEVRTLGRDPGIDAHDFAATIQEWTSARAARDGRAGLTPKRVWRRLQRLAIVLRQVGCFAYGTDDAGCRGKAEALRVTDCHHFVACAQLVGLGEGKRFEPFWRIFDLQQRDI